MSSIQLGGCLLALVDALLFAGAGRELGRLNFCVGLLFYGVG
jgi:hypothetical protein